MTRPGKEPSVLPESNDSTAPSLVSREGRTRLPPFGDLTRNWEFEEYADSFIISSPSAAGLLKPPEWSTDYLKPRTLPVPIGDPTDSTTIHLPVHVGHLGLMRDLSGHISMPEPSRSAVRSDPSQLATEPESVTSHRPRSIEAGGSDQNTTLLRSLGQHGPKLVCPAIYRKTRLEAQVSFLGDHKSKLHRFQEQVKKVFGYNPVNPQDLESLSKIHRLLYGLDYDSFEKVCTAKHYQLSCESTHAVQKYQIPYRVCRSGNIKVQLQMAGGDTEKIDISMKFHPFLISTAAFVQEYKQQAEEQLKSKGVVYHLTWDRQTNALVKIYKDGGEQAILEQLKENAEKYDVVIWARQMANS